ncbi:MAG TPA: FHA domain-containing protein [Candidatus Binataceae bacterium]|nr:FHA domain-containing protein [Candidatus Binataceae bacterium]
MAMTRCSHGHFFDAAKHTACPYCGVGAEAVEGKTRRVPDHVGAATPVAAAPSPGSAASADPGVTRAVYRDTSTGISPVVGWLVCVEGPDKGRDFRIHGEKNFIGRSPSMDIALTGDDSVSRDKHASVAYDPKQRAFWVLPGEAAGLVYLNEQMVNTPMKLTSRDIVEVGKSKLMFWPLCDDKFHWD